MVTKRNCWTVWCKHRMGVQIYEPIQKIRLNRSFTRRRWPMLTSLRRAQTAVKTINRHTSRRYPRRVARTMRGEMQQMDDLAGPRQIRLYQKKKTLRASEQERPDLKELRKLWQEEIGQIDSRRFIFLDESGAKTNMTRLRSWALRGQRAYAATPCGTWNTTTIVSAIS